MDFVQQGTAGEDFLGGAGALQFMVALAVHGQPGEEAVDVGNGASGRGTVGHIRISTYLDDMKPFLFIYYYILNYYTQHGI